MAVRLITILVFISSISGALFFAYDWIRKDAAADLLRQLQLQQIERDNADVEEQEEKKKEIENATDDELLLRACSGGMLPPDACP